MDFSAQVRDFLLSFLVDNAGNMEGIGIFIAVLKHEVYGLLWTT